MFQGRSENGPRALGNRSILFDPTFEDGKDLFNRIKRREYFRPFAGTILLDHAHEWFDMRGLEESPHMMYAMDCLKMELQRKFQYYTRRWYMSYTNCNKRTKQTLL